MSNKKVIDVIKDLQHYVDNYGKYVEVSFVMVAPESVADDDREDIPISYSGEVGTSLLDKHPEGQEDPPIVEIGLTFDSKKDWNEEWKRLENR